MALHEALLRAGVRADLYLLKGTGHGEDVFFQPELRAIILDFLRGAL